MPSWWGLTKRLTYTSQESCQSVYCCSWSMLKSFLKSNTRIFGMRPCVSQSCSTLPLRSSPGFGTALIVVCVIPEFAPVSPVDVELGVGFGLGVRLGLELGVELDVGLGFGLGVGFGLAFGQGCTVGVGSGPAGDVELDVGPVDGMIGFR